MSETSTWHDIPARCVPQLLDVIRKERQRTGSTKQIFVNDRPTICDWCLKAIDVNDGWQECDAWHICVECHSTLMARDPGEFDRLRGVVLQSADGKYVIMRAYALRLRSVFLFPNGMLAVFGPDGQQIPELQGPDSPALRATIDTFIRPETELHGYPRPAKGNRT